eukprot:TRINITY_DN994_c0_g1_i20.p1 TRINITY_DN994_c0_g1~~TRINITY_DN994_c0_g1_i20.p1  ORF type:complete len:417 (-),score=143.54 TRINITY_DN994_c0_g1_i20:170-1420(-)
MKQILHNYILKEIIGSGAHSKVYRACKKDNTNTEFAIKIVPKKNLNGVALTYLKREVELLRSVESEHIVRLMDYMVTEDEHCLVFEYCNGGDLAKFRKSRGLKMEPGLVREILIQIVAGLDVLYSKKIMHRDLKLNNILVSTSPQNKPIVKIGDFSFARLIGAAKEASEVSLSSDLQEMSIVGTPKYMAPELFNNDPYSFKADIWSLGLILYELLCGKSCFVGKTREELIVNIAHGIYKVPKALGLSKECLSFLHNCIQIRSENRFGWKELKEHLYMKKEYEEAFDMKEFRELNPAVKGLIVEDEENYIFNCNRSYSFFAKDKLEDERETLEDSCMPQDQLDESENELRESIKEVERLLASTQFASTDESRLFEMQVPEEDSEYVRIEIKRIPKNYGGDFKTRKYEGLKMIDKYFV